MGDVKVTFKALEDCEDVPIGYAYVNCHMIFDVKMEHFWRKTRLVAGGHMTETPATTTYANIVSWETVYFDLVIAASNYLEVKCGDVMNSYITAPTKKKVWTTLGSEFGDGAGNQALIVCGLYGLKSSGADF